MSRKITQRELRNDSGEIMRQLDEGETFLVTRRGVPVGELVPIRRRRFATRSEIAVAFGGAPPIDLDQLRSDLDRGGRSGHHAAWLSSGREGCSTRRS